MGELSPSEAWDWYEFIDRFAKRGCKVAGYTSEFTLETLLALSSANERRAQPLAGPIRSELDWPSTDLAGILDRLGIRVDVSKIGPLKSVGLLASKDADDEFVRRDRQTVLDALAARMLGTIEDATGCRLDARNEVSSGAEAVQMGLITSVGYNLAMPASWEEAETDRSADLQASGAAWGFAVRHQRTRARGVARRSVCVVTARNSGLPGQSNLQRCAEAMLELSRRHEALVVEYQLSGGDLSEADMFRDVIERLALRLPVFGYVRRAISAGYLAALGCSEIIANPLALLGGVGAVTIEIDLGLLSSTLGGRENEKELVEQSRRRSRERRASLGASLFRARIREARPGCATEPLESGRLLDAHSALDLGLVDHVASLSWVIARACALVGVGPDSVVRLILEPDSHSTLSDNLLGSLMTHAGALGVGMS